jgi:hypothetical protein
VVGRIKRGVVSHVNGMSCFSESDGMVNRTSLVDRLTSWKSGAFEPQDERVLY